MTMQHVTVMQNGMKAMWKWRTMAFKVSVLRLRKQCPEEKGCRNVGGWGGRRGEGIPISVVRAQVQQEVVGGLVQYFQRQRLTRLESKGPGDLYWLSYWATSGSADSFTQQVILQWIGPQILFDNLGNLVGLWKAVV